MSTEAEQLPLEVQLANARAEIAGLKAYAALAHDALLAVEEYWSGGTFERDLYADREMRRGVQDVLAKSPAGAGAELAALRRDKARLDWLADSDKCYYWTFQPQPDGREFEFGTPFDDIRDALDAAMEEGAQ
jgi:hypothetical protein